MRKAGLTAFAVVHALLCLWLIRWTSGPFQVWFDTGEPVSRAEGLGHLAALALSFPGALWALFQHPARVSADAPVMSVAANSLSWATCLFLIPAWLWRRAASNNGTHPTAHTTALK